MKKSKKSIVNLGTAVFYKILVIAVGLLLPKLFITSYGSEINGFQTSVKQLFTYIALLEAGVGTSTIQSLFAPAAKEDKRRINSYMSAASAYYNRIGVIYFVVLALLAFIYSFVVSVDSLSQGAVIAYIIVSGALTGLNFFYFAKLKLLISAVGDQYIITTITMITYLLSSFFKIFFIYVGFSIIAVEAAYLFINIIATFVYYAFAKKKYPWLDLKAKPDKTCLKQKNSVMVHKISSLVFQNMDILFLTFLCNLEVVSVYSMYKMVFSMVTSVVSEIGNSMNFMLGQEFNASEDKSKYTSLIDTFNVYYSAIAFSLYTVTYILIIPFLKLYTDGLDINYIYFSLPMLYICMEFLTVGREAMLRTIDVAGHFKKTQWRTLTETIINLVLTFILIILLKGIFGDIGGIYGALIGTIIALLYRTIDINIYANKNILHRRSFKTFSVMIINIVLFIVVAIITNHINLNIDNYWQFLIHGCCITILMLALFIIVHSSFRPRELKNLLVACKATLNFKFGKKVR